MYPKWRQHPTKESQLIWSHDWEVSLTPDSEGWRDDRNFPTDNEPVVEEAPKLKRGRKKVTE